MTASQGKEKIKLLFDYCFQVRHEAADTAARQDGLVPIGLFDQKIEFKMFSWFGFLIISFCFLVFFGLVNVKAIGPRSTHIIAS